MLCAQERTSDEVRLELQISQNIPPKKPQPCQCAFAIWLQEASGLKMNKTTFFQSSKAFLMPGYQLTKPAEISQVSRLEQVKY